MKRDFAIAALLSVCCNFALAATSPLASTNDYYYTVPKTTNIFGRVMGERGDYRLVRAEDVAWINEAWAERKALAQEIGWGEAWPGGPLVKRGYGAAATYWEKGTLQTCVVTGATMAARLAEASGGAMTNVVYATAAPARLVSLAAITNEFATLKKMEVLAASAGVTYTNDNARVVYTSTLDDGEGVYVTVSTNRVTDGTWGVEGGGSESVWDGIVVEDGQGRYAGEPWSSKDKWTGDLQGSVRMRLALSVQNTNDWLRGESSPKVVRSVRAWAAVDVDGSREREVVTYKVAEVEPDRWGEVTNSYEREEWSTNATVLVDMGEASWVEAKGNSLVYEVGGSLSGVLGDAAGAVPGMPSVAEVRGAGAAYPAVGGVGHASVGKSVWCDIRAVYLVIGVKPVTSLPGW